MLPPLDASSLSRRLIRPLTRSEVRVALLIGEGLSEAQLVTATGIGAEGIRHHLQNVADKIGEAGVAPMALRRMERIRFWIQCLHAEALQRELDIANGTLVAQGAVRRSGGQREA